MERKNVIETVIGQDVARSLIGIGAFMDKSRSPDGQGFRLKLHQTQPDAPLSPMYMNLRLLQSFPNELRKVVRVYRRMMRQLIADTDGFDPKVLAGIPLAGSPIATALSIVIDMPMITPRQPKKHGLPGAIDGVVIKGQQVVLIDDLITGSHSKIEAAKVLRDAGLNPQAVLVLIDREQGGEEGVRADRMWFEAAFTIRELLAFYLAENLISSEVEGEITVYLDEN